MTKKITIGTIIGLITTALIIGGILWSQGGTHAAEAKQVETNKTHIAEMKPEVTKNTRARIGMEKDIEHINEGIDRIELTQTTILKELRKP